MRSAYIKALLLSIGILVFSLAGFLVISRTMTYRLFAKGTPIAPECSHAIRGSQPGV